MQESARGLASSLGEVSKSQTDMQADLGEIQSLLVTSTRAHQTMKEEVRSAIADSQDSIITTVKGEIDAANTAMKDDIRNFQESMHNAIATLTTDVSDILKKILTPPPPTPPVLGKNGYLRHKFPAPSGWGETAYERVLERVGWEYIVQCGNLDAGVSADGHVSAWVRAKFPYIDEEHMVVAVEHAHRRAYGRPLGEESHQ
ncbi:hypothetical protein M426DRAFT_11170 [Hypoxylon sp. CI-4A]|nr:hypothetical protein M426DRAFT_11170 [Hypoxylon sp. CI-4A]